MAGFAAAALLIYSVGRGTTFFYDEWNFILERRTGGLNAFLLPHGGHWSTVPVGVYRLLFALVGLRHYGAYRATLIAFHLACCGFFYLLARRRIGPFAALVPTALLLFLGSAWQDLLWPFQIGYLGSIGGGLGSLLALDARNRRGDLAACFALLVSLASSGLGIPFAVAALLELLLLRGWRRLWVALLPLALFGIWYVAYGRGSSGAQLGNLGKVPSYVVRSALGAAEGMVGASGRWQGLVGLAVFSIVIAALVVGRRISPRLLMVLSMPLVFWGLAALTRGQLDEPAASRYVYPGAVFLLLLAVEGLRGFRLPAWSALFALLLVPALLGNVQRLQDGAHGLLGVSTSVRAELGAVEIARRTVPHDFRPDPLLMPQVTAGPYLAAVEALGSPADQPAIIGQQIEPIRAAVDEVLLRTEGVQSTGRPSPGVRLKLSLDKAGGAIVVSAGDCVTATAPPSGTAVELSVRQGSLQLDAANAIALVYIRRFADEFPDAPFDMVHPGSPSSQGPPQTRWLALPSDGATAPWHIGVFTRGTISLCAFSP